MPNRWGFVLDYNYKGADLILLDVIWKTAMEVSDSIQQTCPRAKLPWEPCSLGIPGGSDTAGPSLG